MYFPEYFLYNELDFSDSIFLTKVLLGTIQNWRCHVFRTKTRREVCKVLNFHSRGETHMCKSWENERFIALLSCDKEACRGQNRGFSIPLNLDIDKTICTELVACSVFSSIARSGHPDPLRPQTRCFPGSLTIV